MNYDAIEKARKEAPLRNLSTDKELHYNDSYPAVPMVRALHNSIARHFAALGESRSGARRNCGGQI